MITYCCPNIYQKVLFYARKKHKNYKSQVPNLFIRQGYPYGDASFATFFIQMVKKRI